MKKTSRRVVESVRVRKRFPFPPKAPKEPGIWWDTCTFGTGAPVPALSRPGQDGAALAQAGKQDGGSEGCGGEKRPEGLYLVPG